MTHIYDESTNITEGCNVAFASMIAKFSQSGASDWQVIREITWRWANVA